MTKQEQFEISMSKSGCAELMVTICIHVQRTAQCSDSLAKGWFSSISISPCSFVMHVCPNLSMRMHVLKEWNKEKTK